MENTATEQSVSNPAPAATDRDDKVKTDSFGKFSNGDELLKAYNALEAEFTRRSQRLKELEGKFETRKQEEVWEKKLQELHDKYPVSGTLGREIGEYLKANQQLISSEDCLEKALLNVLASRSYGETKKNQATAAVEQTESVRLTNAVSSEAATAEIGISETQSQEITAQPPRIPVMRALSPAGISAKPHNIAEAGKLAAEHLKKIKGE